MEPTIVNWHDPLMWDIAPMRPQNTPRPDWLVVFPTECHAIVRFQRITPAGIASNDIVFTAESLGKAHKSLLQRQLDGK